MSAQWLENTGNVAERISAALGRLLQYLALPENARRLRQALLALLLVWGVFALVQLLWSLWPNSEPAPLPANLLNPLVHRQTAPAAAGVDLEALLERQLFGEPGAEVVAVVEPEVAPEQRSEREGIEDGARETRLDLTLRGVVASTEDGLGHAIIEYRSEQAVYAVDDKLPVSGNVVLAKVMPGQVVLDNGGTYELLTLFEKSNLDEQLQAASSMAREVEAPATPTTTTHIDQRADDETTELAASYRDQLYENPQSLASLVRISAVRSNGELQGYRVMPGKETAQFRALGFEPGDLVTSVNGIALNNPSNTMQLYQTMRTAREAVFELERQGQPVQVSVDLGADLQNQ